MDVYVEEGGNNIIRHQHYFNFDVRTGRGLVVGDLLDSARLDSFTRKVLMDKRKLLERYKMKTLKTALAKRTLGCQHYETEKYFAGFDLAAQEQYTKALTAF